MKKSKKKVARHWSFILNAVLLCILAFILIKPQSDEIVDLSKFTQNNLSASTNIYSGMTSQQVLEVMGPPAIKEFNKQQEQWHYCTTGSIIDKYIAIGFSNNKVTDMSFYTVSWLDLAFHYTPQPSSQLLDLGGLGDCTLTIRWGSYNKKEPNNIKPPEPKNN